MIIDCHTHGMHGGRLEGVEAAGGPWIKKQIDNARGKPIFSDVKGRVAQLDRHGYDYQIVTPQWSFDANLCPGDDIRAAYTMALNDNMARMQEESNGRLLCIGNVALEDYEKSGRKEAERVVKTLGMKGIFLCTHVRGKPIDSPEFEAFWAHAQEMDIPVVIHPAMAISAVSRPYEGRYDLMRAFGWPYETILCLAGLVFSGIIERYPKIKISTHHLGGGLPFIFGRIYEHYNEDPVERIGRRLPQDMKDLFRTFYYDTAVGTHSPAVKCTYEAFGIDRMIFATDAPFGPGRGDYRMENYPKMVRAVGLSEAENKKIFEDNPRKLFKI
jgi:predicted TIM-barrel fold metal-dependent hydrolase